jgi:hypothetical protein
MKQYFLAGMALAFLAVGMTASGPARDPRICNSSNQGATRTAPHISYGPNCIAVDMCIGTSYQLVDLQVCSSTGRCTSL